MKFTLTTLGLKQGPYLNSTIFYIIWQVLIKFLDDEEESSTDDSLLTRQGRKLELKETQGRFSIKEKLCSLGLADVSLESKKDLDFVQVINMVDFFSSAHQKKGTSSHSLNHLTIRILNMSSL